MPHRGYRFTIREFLLAYLYNRPAAAEELVEALEAAEEKGLILLGGRRLLEEDIRLLEALGIIRRDGRDRLYLDKTRLHPETAEAYREKAKLLQSTLGKLQ